MDIQLHQLIQTFLLGDGRVSVIHLEELHQIKLIPSLLVLLSFPLLFILLLQDLINHILRIQSAKQLFPVPFSDARVTKLHYNRHMLLEILKFGEESVHLLLNR